VNDVEAPLRESARIILLDGDDNTLLLHYVDDEICIDPNEPGLVDYWVTPGGGLESGETFVDAARRELIEETGFEVSGFDGPVVRRRYPLIIRGAMTRCVEHLFVARLDALRPEPDISRQNADELKPLRGLAWWTLDDLRTTRERIFPAELGRIIAGWRDGILGPTPIELA
jgi:8-oxo-dGTP diphosphatase